MEAGLRSPVRANASNSSQTFAEQSFSAQAIGQQRLPIRGRLSSGWRKDMSASKTSSWLGSPPMCRRQRQNTKETFWAPVMLNGNVIGGLDEKLLTLQHDTVECRGDRIPIKMMSNRILRIGGPNIGRDGYQVKLPKLPCGFVEVYYSPDGCKALVDGDVIMEQYRIVDVADARIQRVVSETDAARRPVSPPPPANHAEEMYNRWNRTIDQRQSALKVMEDFVCIPTEYMRCPRPRCSLHLPDGSKRLLRETPFCKHDIESWFREASGGFNEAYLQRLTAQEYKWDVVKLKPGDPQLTSAQRRFRDLQGETWNIMVTLQDEFDARKRESSA